MIYVTESLIIDRINHEILQKSPIIGMLKPGSSLVLTEQTPNPDYIVNGDLPDSLYNSRYYEVVGISHQMTNNAGSLDYKEYVLVEEIENPQIMGRIKEE